jgi:hypothetical protein
MKKLLKFRDRDKTKTKFQKERNRKRKVSHLKKETYSKTAGASL